LNHRQNQRALILFSQYSAEVMRHKAIDGVVCVIVVWFKYNNAALSLEWY